MYIVKLTEACNFRCQYCFYVNSGKVNNPKWIDINSLKKTINSILEREKIPRFSFHGGEPLMIGIDVFSEVLNYIHQTCYELGNDAYVSVQTNGSLINDNWCELFKEYNVNVGISYDGDLVTHQKLRSANLGHLTLNGIECLLSNGINVSMLIVVTQENSKLHNQIFNNLCNIGITSWDYLPCIEKYPGQLQPTIAAKDYGEFLVKSFDYWVEKDNERITIRFFNEIIRAMLGYKPRLCRMIANCVGIQTINPDGTIFPCDRFVDNPDFEIGNYDDLKGIKINRKGYKRVSNIFDLIDEQCKNCKWYALCSGGCCYQRFLNGKNIDYLCTSYKMIFSRINYFLEEHNLLN